MHSVDIYFSTFSNTWHSSYHWLPKVELKRHYWAVGAGLFTSQQLRVKTAHETKTLNIVYDCGSHNQNLINREIDEYVSMINSDVDFLFISHLDKDHISGLEYLKEKLDNIGKRIKRIYYPFLDLPELLFLSSAPKNRGMENILINIKIHLGRLADEVIAVHPPESPESTNPEIPELPAPENHRSIINDDLRKFDLATNNDLNEKNSMAVKVWNFSFCTLPAYDKRDGFYKDLAAALQKDKGKILQETKRNPYIDKKFLSLLQQCYKKQKGLNNLNNTSLCIYSGPPREDEHFKDYEVLSHQFISHCWATCKIQCCISPPKPGWIGTGDAPLGTRRNITDFNNLFSDFKPHCGSITVPHHGAKRNWNDLIMSSFPIGSFCFMGANGRYGHPSDHVIDRINNLGHFPANMTGSVHTRFVEICTIYLWY